MATDLGSIEEIAIKAECNGLLLYHALGSAHSQKVLFALHEKQLEFSSSLIDLTSGEQYQPWYMKINPKGEVPVLKDGVKIIPDSSRILDYLEDNFSNGDTPHLMPEKGTEQAQKVDHMRKLLETTPFSAITFGTVFFPELAVDSKMPALERKYRSVIINNLLELLDELIETHPEYKDNYLEKKEKIKTNFLPIQNIETVKKSLADVEKILDAVESEIGSHTEENANWWLCSENFTIPDIILSLLLHRIDYVGLWNYYFSDNKRSNLAHYYLRVQEKDSFKKTFDPEPNLGIVIPGGSKCLVAVTVLLGAVAAGAIMYRRIK